MGEVSMPRLSDTMEEGELAKWLKNVGDPVAKGDVLAEIETDKATMDLEAFEDGVLEQQLVEEGTLVPIGQPVAIIGDGSGASSPAPADGDEEDAAAEEGAGEEDAGAEGAAEPEAEEPAAEEEPADEQAEEPAAARKPQAEPADRLRTGGIPRMSPLARKLAKDHGLDPGSIAGTGPGGRVIRADVEAAIADAASAPSRPAADASRPDDQADTTRVPVSRIRKVAAKRLTESQLVPHFFLTAIADVDALLDLRVRLNAELEPQGVKLSINDLIVKAVAVTLTQHPEANARWDEDAIIENHRVNIGMAVATDDGLLVPVIKDADRKSPAQIATESRELAAKARDGKLKLEEMSGGTFSVSNLGMFGIDEFTAMLNPPEAGILAVGAAGSVPTLRDGELVEVSRLKLTLTCDHRVMDGAVGAAFLRDVVETLERPLRILL